MKGANTGRAQRSKDKRESSTQEELSTGSPPWEEVARRAYELYLTRGRTDGHADTDWLQAERELQGNQSKKR